MDNVSVIIDIFNAAYEEILASIENVDLTKTPAKLAWLKSTRLILARYWDGSKKIIKESVKGEYDSGIKEVQEAFKGLPITGGFNVPDPQTAKFLISNVDDILANTEIQVQAMLSNSYANISKILSQVEKNVQNELISSIAKGNILGKSRIKVQNELISILKNKGITGFSSENKNGKIINYDLSSSVEAIVRSANTTARASSVINSCLERGYDLVKVDKHKNESKMCEHWGGEVLSITGQTEGYPKLSDALFQGDYKKGGIFHRYCRHSLSVYIPTDSKFK